MNSTLWNRLGDLWLGTEKTQRRRAAHTLHALLVFIVFAAVQQVEVWSGLIDQTESNLITLYNLTGSSAFFWIVRSGMNLRFASDPSLSFPQCLFGVTATCLSYAITGPARGGIMAIMLLILAFAMFSLNPRNIRLLSLIAFSLLASVMAWKAATYPQRYVPAVEFAHSVIAAILMSSIAVLSSRMGTLRERLQRQKSDLEHALNQNRRLATLDELTGLFNRRHMGATLLAEHERQIRGGQCMSVALIDIDLFKRVNDQYGHQAGDTVLREFARLATATLRTGDTASRWGGEEFLIVMPDTGTAEAVLAIDRLRTEFATLCFPLIDNALSATFSAGIATHFDSETVDSLVERADQNMYAAKAAGRNRVFANHWAGHLPDPPAFARPLAPSAFAQLR